MCRPSQVVIFFSGRNVEMTCSVGKPNGLRGAPSLETPIYNKWLIVHNHGDANNSTSFNKLNPVVRFSVFFSPSAKYLILGTPKKSKLSFKPSDIPAKKYSFNDDCWGIAPRPKI